MRKDAGANLSNRFILSITYLNKKNQIFSNQFYTREILVVFFFISDKRTKKIDDQITNEMNNQIKQMPRSIMPSRIPSDPNNNQIITNFNFSFELVILRKTKE
jgi:hypothetical protein